MAKTTAEHISQVRAHLSERVLKNPDAPLSELEQWCVQSRDALVVSEVPVSQADKAILSVMTGKMGLNDFRTLKAYLELTDPPDPQWKSASKDRLLVAAKTVWQSHPYEKPNSQELESLTTVFTASTREMIQHGVPRRIAVADLTGVLAQNLPSSYVEDLMLEIQMRSLGRRVKGSDPAPA